jgi:hypothetical protein
VWISWIEGSSEYKKSVSRAMREFRFQAGIALELIVHWIDQDLGYVLIGDLDKQTLAELAMLFISSSIRE